LDNFNSFISLLPTLNASNVSDIALSLFQFQVTHNPVYAQYVKHLNVSAAGVTKIADIPFMPISLFKSHILKTGHWAHQTFYTSSGTSGNTTSTHYIADEAFYLQHAEHCFTRLFGPLTDYHFLALMPSYLERSNSSLIAMMDSFIKKSNSPHSGFYLYEYDKLVSDISQLRQDRTKKVILWGVSFALLDLAEKLQPDLSGCLIFETGGMKGRRKEIIREELHHRLKASCNVEAIYSEYGMTELLSQAYTKGENRFYPPLSMKILVRNILDPFEKGLVGSVGGLNIIDLANVHSIAFIETEDSGKVFEDGSFEVLGRLDNSDVRGCNLLVE
jgi:hypothetical protein